MASSDLPTDAVINLFVLVLLTGFLCPLCIGAVIWLLPFVRQAYQLRCLSLFSDAHRVVIELEAAPVKRDGHSVRAGTIVVLDIRRQRNG